MGGTPMRLGMFVSAARPNKCRETGGLAPFRYNSEIESDWPWGLCWADKQLVLLQLFFRADFVP